MTEQEMDDKTKVLNVIKSLYFENSKKPITVKILHMNVKYLKPEKTAKILRWLVKDHLIKFDETNLIIEPIER